MIASIHINGKQRLKRVKTEEQAREWFLCVETQSVAASQLSFKQLNDAAAAFTIMKEQHVEEVSLSDIVRQWIQGNAPAHAMILREAMEDYLQRSRSRIAERTLKGYSQMLRKFVADVGEERNVASFKKADAIRWLDRFNDMPPTWRAYQRTLSKFYAECVKMDWCLANPFSNLDAPKAPPPERKFLSVEDAKLALQSVMKRKPALIHFLTLGLFAGIRPIESLRLTSKHFNLETGYIHLSGDITKSHSFKERVVPINDTLRAWLEAYPFEEKPIPVGDICYVDKAIKDCANLDHWERTPDGLRHSFATYEFARSRNSAETAAICGHAEAIAMKHYRGRVTPEEADRYFSLVPGTVVPATASA
jgi:integrase